MSPTPRAEATHTHTHTHRYVHTDLHNTALTNRTEQPCGSDPNPEEPAGGFLMVCRLTTSFLIKSPD